MNLKLTHKHTMYCCFLAYITSAIINNLAPLLFLTFQDSYSITTAQIGYLVSLNFIIQMCIDYLGAKYADNFGYRKTILSALMFSALGLIALAVLPQIMSYKLAALTIAVVLYAIGSGLIEVMVSPITEALPTKNKDAVMSLMHSFYCWGHVFVVLVSTIYFVFVGIQKWYYLVALWALIPLITALLFVKVPLYTLKKEGEEPLKISNLFKNKIFKLFLILMVCSGAAELAMAQWASYFAQMGLKVSKTIGDLFGPCLFAILMGISRVFYARFNNKINLIHYLKLSTALCILSYLIATLNKNPVIALLGCGLCGLSVGIMWPGVLSLASSKMPKSGTALFATLAVGGDIGCFLGPETVSIGASVFKVGNSAIKAGLLCSVVFPVIMLVCISTMGKGIDK